MDIFSVLSLIGGLALFLYGMNVMGDGLVMASGGKLEKILSKLTGKRITGLLLGAGVTAVIQSSSATTVMVVGFVNSGMMKLTQAVGVIMGANIGTTATSWILSLTGVDGSSVLIKMLKPTSFSPILAIIGVILIMTNKDGSTKRNVGTIMVGFAVLMTGMHGMSSAVEPLADNEAFTNLLITFSNPILGLLAGAILTAIIQSSSASVGILQALCLTGMVSYGTAIPIIMGQNIGTCITAIISSIGANKNAKRAAMIHLYFNLIGTILFMVVFYSLNSFLHFAFLGTSATAWGIAVVHSLFNIGCAIVLFPFGNGLVKLAILTIRDKKGEEDAASTMPKSLAALDERFLETPAVAVHLCKSAVDDMADVSRRAIQLSREVLQNYSAEKAQKVIALEQEADLYEDVLGSYLVRISGRDMTAEDSRLLSIILHSLTDFERISDHAINLVESAQELHDKNLSLTKSGRDELNSFSKAISDIMDKAVHAFISKDLNLAKGVEPLEEVVDTLCIEMKQRHIDRLREGKCSLETGLILQDIITNYERVSDHCSNVAVCLIEVRKDAYETHEYLNQEIAGNDEWFNQEVLRLREQYKLPAAK